MGPTCAEDFVACSDKIPCNNVGQCIFGQTDVDTDNSCKCEPGFEGVRCEINIDDCQSAQCPANADCIDGINKYTCKCRKGYIGENCDRNINECESSSPCENGATCLDLKVKIL